MAGIIEKTEELVQVLDRIARDQKWNIKCTLEDGTLSITIIDKELNKEYVERLCVKGFHSAHRVAYEVRANAVRYFRQSMSVMEKLAYLRDAVKKYCDDVRLEFRYRPEPAPDRFIFRFYNRRTMKIFERSVHLELIQDIKVFADSLIDKVNRELIVPEHTPEKRYITTGSPYASIFRKEMEAMINSPKQRLTGSLTTGYHYGVAVGDMYIDDTMWKKNNDKTDALRYSKEALNMRFGKNGYRVIPEIKNVIFNNPATIVMWGDGTKTVVKAVDEEFDEEKGLAMAIAKKCLGNEGKYFNEFRKWLPEKKEEEKVVEKHSCESCAHSTTSLIDLPCSACLEYGDKPFYAAKVPMTVRAASMCLQVSESTIREYIKKGEFKGAEKVNGKWMIPSDEVKRKLND